jgi:hypothetical protein
VGCPGADHSFMLIQPLTLKTDDDCRRAEALPGAALGLRTVAVVWGKTELETSQ